MVAEHAINLKEERVMATSFVTRKTSRFEAADVNETNLVLIFGDEVETIGDQPPDKVKAKFRGHEGYIKKDALGPDPALEIYFIDVGQGDSTFIVTPGRKKILIDGGINARARGFLAWKYRLDELHVPVDIDLLVLSHADEDHLKGLVPIVSHPLINVRKVVHSGIACFPAGVYETELGKLDAGKQYLLTRHDGLKGLSGLSLTPDFERWRKALEAEGVEYEAVCSATRTIDTGDPLVTIDVLGPCLDTLNGQPVFRWFDDKPHTINGHSVVLRLTYDDVSVLLSGDVNAASQKCMLADRTLAGKLDAHIFKAPHHGSREFDYDFLKAVRPQISVISSGDDRDHGHPRAVFIGSIGLASRPPEPLVFSTEIAGNFVEVKDPGQPAAQPSPAAGATPGERADSRARLTFKRRLHGMINVRTDGRKMYAARRVAAPYQWESYGPLTPSPRP
jgi:competence protein ComEC